MTSTESVNIWFGLTRAAVISGHSGVEVEALLYLCDPIEGGFRPRRFEQ